MPQLHDDARGALARTLGRPVPGWLMATADVVGLSLIALFLHGFVQRNFLAQGDLVVYRFAGRAVLDGLDPYVQENLAALANRPVFPFLYPPVALLPCMAIATLSWHALALTWMWSKIVLLGVLILVGAKGLVRLEMILPMALVAIFGWNAAALRDLSTGNIAILEAALVWAGLVCYVRGHRWAFAALIVIAACFKLAPAAFLALLLVPTERARPSGLLFAGSGLALLLIVGGPLLVGPAADYRHFWGRVSDLSVTGSVNPSIIEFTQSLVAATGWKLPWTHPEPVIWGVFCAGLVAISLPFLTRCYRARDARRWCMTAAFLYVLLVPRPMAYGFVMLVPACLYFSPSFFGGLLGPWLLALTLSAQGLFKFTSIVSTSPMVVYAPSLLNVCLWLLVLGDTRKPADSH